MTVIDFAKPQMTG